MVLVYNVNKTFMIWYFLYLNLKDATHDPHPQGQNLRKHYYKEEVEPLIHHIESYYNITNYSCPRSTSPKIILVGRKFKRQIQNAKSIIMALKER